jgi:hypothetical protein
VPLDLHADVVKTASSIDLKSISGQIAGDPVQGSTHIDLGGEQPRFTLAAKVVSVSLPSLLGSLVAWQRTPSTEALLGSLNQNASDVWPSRGFALEPLGKVDGEIKIEAKKLTLGAPLRVDDAVLVARVDGEGLSITDVQGRLFGGSFAASGTLTPKGTGAELKAHAELASGKLDQLSQQLVGRVLAKGPFTLAFDISGEGLSPPGLVAGLNGEGTLFLDPGALQALSPEPLKRLAGEANRSKKIKLDKDQIAARMRTLQDTLTRGSYAYAETALPFDIKNGTLKLAPASLASKGANTTINGYVELASLRLDSEWAMRLNGSRDADMPPVNLVFAGSLRDAGAITPLIDTAPMESFLTVRRMQDAVERLETLDVSGRNQSQSDAEPAAATAADVDSTTVSQQPDAPSAEQAETKEKLAAEKAAVEKRAAERAAEAERVAAEKAADEKRAAEKAAQDKRAAEKAAADKLAAEKAAADKRAAEKAAADKLAAEKAAAEKRAAEKAAAEQRAAEKAAAAAAEKAAAEKAAADNLAAEKAAAVKAAAEKRAAEKAAADKLAAEKAAADKLAAEKVAAEKAATDKQAAEKAAADKLAAERAAEKAAAEKRQAEKAPASTPQAAHPTTPRAADLEANIGTPSVAPSGGQEPERLPWSQTPAGTDQASPMNSPAADAQPTPAGAVDSEVAPSVAPRPPRRAPSRPATTPDDWKKGISIFGGG